MNINFPKINVISRPVNINNVSRISFGTCKALECDTFESPSIRIIRNTDGRGITGKTVKNLTLENRKDGRPVDGFIIQDFNRSYPQYFVGADGKNQGRMILTEGKGCMMVEELYGHYNKGEFKGAGSELIKFAVEQSEEKGFNGRLKLFIGGSFPFYYKNNFRIVSDSNLPNAALDYITRTGASVDAIWKSNWPVKAYLDDDGVKALKEGRRLYEETKSQTLYSKEVKFSGWKRPLNIDMHFCDLGDSFAILMIDKNAKRGAVLGGLEGKIENGQLIPDELDKYLAWNDDEEVQQELHNALLQAQELYSE